jgi:hypothetical protein
MGNAGRAIVGAGMLCGVMDITAALIVYGQFGLRPQRLLQGIAAALIGRGALEGGWATAGLGLFLHFVIAFGAATTFYVASRWMGFLVEQWAVWGALYGVAVYFLMQNMVLPLSAVGKRPFSWNMMWIGLVIHIICVGWPIAWGVTRFGGTR